MACFGVYSKISVDGRISTFFIKIPHFGDEDQWPIAENYPNMICKKSGANISSD